MPFEIVRNDITKMEVDAIVNAANTALQMGGGVCRAIFNAAGASELQAVCDGLAPIKTGDAVITPAFQLPAKHIIHTAGPVYRDGRHNEEKLLRASYQNALMLAEENGCGSIAFPLISSGIYGYPKEEALQIAKNVIGDFLSDHEMTVYLVVFDKEAFTLSEKLLGEVSAYIDEHHVEEHMTMFSLRKMPRDMVESPEKAEFMPSRMYQEPPDLDDLVGGLDESFSQTLLRLIDSKGKKDVDVYKKANIDRKHFSKIRSSVSYTPSKRTAVALAIALELTLEQTEDLLKRAGYTFSNSRKFDVIIKYYIENKKFDIFEINVVLFHYDQQLLGG